MTLGHGDLIGWSRATRPRAGAAIYSLSPLQQRLLGVSFRGRGSRVLQAAYVVILDVAKS